MERSPKDAFAIYLRNHEAAAQAGRDFARRAARAQRSGPQGDRLARLAVEIEQDAHRLQALMRGASVSPDPVQGLVLRAGERLGRFKPNGHLLSRAPLSDLIEVEGLLDAVRAKWAAWLALTAMGPDALRQRGVDPVEVEELATRAERQVELLLRLHAEVAARVLASG